jgi:hypothetical protein
MNPFLDLAEKMEELSLDEKANVLQQLTTHACNEIMRVAEKTLSHKSFRRLKVAVDKARGK